MYAYQYRIRMNIIHKTAKWVFFVIIFIFRHISTKVGVKANIVLFNSCVKIPFKDLHTLLKYEQKLKGLFFSDSS